jgi:crotonobetainyl-CoA:carnitine CoA-transferase CaiB-like acyl-CoA transferase
MRRQCPPTIGQAAPDDASPRPSAAATGASLGSPLEGVRVIDLGLAVAGPFGAQMLGDLGADVIRVSQTAENPLIANQIQLLCNRNKRSIALDLKNPEGLAVLLRMVEQADVVHSNMRYNALERLGLDYESLRKINPRLIYCHTRGHERGPRQYVEGHDQSASALAGVSWMEGGLDDGGRPIWPMTSVGDIGCGLLSAIAVVQALYHRDRTGEGQFVDTAIVCAHLLNTSSAWITADGSQAGPRHQLDAMQLGWNARYRLYHTADDRWLCLAAVTEDHWQRLCAAVGHRVRVGDAAGRGPRVGSR